MRMSDKKVKENLDKIKEREAKIQEMKDRRNKIVDDMIAKLKENKDKILTVAVAIETVEGTQIKLEGAEYGDVMKLLGLLDIRKDLIIKNNLK